MAKDHGQRIVTCSKHGIPYDASKRGGCSRCIREWERNKSKPASDGGGGIPTPVWLLGVLVLVMGLYFWLQGSSDSGDAHLSTSTPSPESTTSNFDTKTSASVAALRKIIDDLPQVIRSGRSETEPYLADVGNPQRQKENWDFWSMNWQNRIGQLRDRMPTQPDSQKHLKLAILFQDVSQALSELAAISQATKNGIPEERRAKAKFLAAEKALQSARLHLSQLHK